MAFRRETSSSSCTSRRTVAAAVAAAAHSLDAALRTHECNEAHQPNINTTQSCSLKTPLLQLVLYASLVAAAAAPLSNISFASCGTPQQQQQYTVRQHACTKLLAQTCRYMHARSVTARSLHYCDDVSSKGCAQWCSQQHHCGTERMTHAMHTTPHSHKLTCMSSCSGGILHTYDTLVHLLVYH
eukprot:7591-Heterococcus_DN1.PRE.2